MAILTVCAVKDSAMGMYNRPFFTPSSAVAVRSFVDEVNREAPPEQNPMYAHPDDFELHSIALFDEERGQFVVPPEGVTVLARAKDHKAA